MNKNRVFLVVIILISCVSAFANGGLFGWKGVYGSLGRFVGSAQTIDLSALNEEIGFNFEVTYPETFMKYGAQYLFLTNNVALGVEGYLISNGVHKDEVYNYEVSGSAAFFDLGYVFYSNYHTILTPWVGIGMGNLEYSMVSHEQTWIQAVDQGIPYVFSSTKQNLLFDVGISWDAVYRNMAIGFHAAYMIPLDTADWKIAGEVMEDGPDSALDGLHLGISFGFADIDMW